ncbi:hypothetical protein JK386_12600 [Nocardioides sp. zg-536]|uniref:Uncharacterized protein n=1 Tax=Nocardioides faecalis TaxID=2803858 RepID=A0A938YB32_9ACTN|nr:hypothetical protein [Nocardioides faecalis]MBM9460746.1 hypothetical protein [Nocardioides faecalis]MBS4752685.1 hypothetical protein [Nocardioides faecalis]QVI57943.1 hypothetical protein KG111_12975 [Nocardioides faecalis]
MKTTPTAPTAPTADARRSGRLRALALPLSVALAVAVLVLSIMVWHVVAGGPTVAADVGEQVPLRSPAYGRSVTVKVPGSEVMVRVGAPVDTLGHELLEVEYADPEWDEQQDLVAPEDGSLVPVSWKVRGLGGFAVEGDPKPVEVRLVVGEQRVDLATIVRGDLDSSADGIAPPSVAVGIEGRPSVEDLAVEVEYDGLTQTADVESGEIEAGVAEALYDENHTFSTGCADAPSPCAFTAADPDSPLRPRRAAVTASDLTLYPYDAELGWADEGTSWASVQLQLFGADTVENAAGDAWFPTRLSAPVVTLDGAEPARREGLTASSRHVVGRAVFAVDTDAKPRELVVEQVLSFTAGPQDLPMRARLPLSEAD